MKKDQITFAVHGKKAVFSDVESKLENLIDSFDSTYPSFKESSSSQEVEKFEPELHKVFFKTPLAVNMCT